MSGWEIALVAAGSAIAGGLVTGWFTRPGGKQALLVAGDPQADALAKAVQMAVREHRALQMFEVRRRTYMQFIQAAESVCWKRTTGGASPADRLALHQALAAVELEGPPDVADAAREIVDRSRKDQSLDELDDAKLNFISTAHGVLSTITAAAITPAE
jgi:hypothetical protein